MSFGDWTILILHLYIDENNVGVTFCCDKLMGAEVPKHKMNLFETETKSLVQRKYCEKRDSHCTMKKFFDVAFINFSVHLSCKTFYYKTYSKHLAIMKLIV